MNDLTLRHDSLPDTIEDLAKFALIGREKLSSVKAEIRAIDKLQLAQDVREQKREESQMLAEALLDAEVKLGELFKQMPKAPGTRTDLEPRCTAATRLETKEQAADRLGFERTQVHRFETLASHPDLVEQVKAEARENDDLPTRTAVLNLAKHREEKSKAAYRQIDEDHRLSVLLTKALAPVELLPTDMESIAAMRRGEGPTIEVTRRSLRKAINNLILIQREFERG